MSRMIVPFPVQHISTAIRQRILASKRIRSLLLFALNDQNATMSTSNEILLALGAALEFLHQASLILDDTIDEHRERGGRQSLHYILGNDIAAAGKAAHVAEYLLALSEQCVLDSALSPEKQVTLLQLITKTKIRMIEAQFIDTISSPKPLDMTWLRWCIDHGYEKTKALVVLPFTLTGIIHEMPAAECGHLVHCGECLGIAYQIDDDLQDVRAGIHAGPVTLTLPLAFLLDNKDVLTAPEQNLLSRLLTSRRLTEADREPFEELVHKYKASIQSIGIDEKQKQLTGLSLPDGIKGSDVIADIATASGHGDFWSNCFATTSLSKGIIECALRRGREFLLMQREGDEWKEHFGRRHGLSNSWASAYIARLLQDMDPSGVSSSGVTDCRQLLLKQQHKDGGWSYNETVPADADTTTNVLLLLKDQWCCKSAYDRGVAFLLAHQCADGGVATFSSGNVVRMGYESGSEGWASSHPCVTALAAQVLQGNHLERAKHYLRAQKRADGLWPSYWWTSDLYASLEAIRVLGFGQDTVEAIKNVEPRSSFELALKVQALMVAKQPCIKDVRSLLSVQRQDGSWPSSALLMVPRPNVPLLQLDRSSVSTSVDRKGLFSTVTALAALQATLTGRL